MNHILPSTISRDELSALTGLRVEVLERREKSIGLRAVKIKLATRPILYQREPALQIMRGLGVLR